MTDRLNKTSICSIVFLDIIDYSKKPVSEQIEDKTFFNALINEAIENVAPNDRIILDTGDGAAITLMGAPEEALFIALAIRDGILERNKDNPQPLLVRIGINLGSIRVMKDLNDRPNIIGDGINVAQRIMSFADANQILVSRSYYEVTSRLTKEITSMFSYSGIKQDKHIREHEVYIIKSKAEGGTEPELQPELDTATGLNFPNKKLLKLYLIPIVVVSLFVALMALYLLVLRPVPGVGNERVEELYQPEASAKAAAVRSNIKTDIPVTKLEAKAQVLPSIETAEISKLPISTDSALSTNSVLTSKENKSANTKAVPKAKKKQVNKDKAIAHNENKVSAETEIKSKTEVKPKAEVKPRTEKPTHQSENIMKPVLEHACTQAEIVMNQCK